MSNELLIKMDSVKTSGMDWFYRMEALAQELDDYMQITFLCKQADTEGAGYLKSKGMTVIKYADDNELFDLVREYEGASIIIDNKHRVNKLEKVCEDLCNKVIYMDENADRSFKADMIINPLYGSQFLDYFVAADCEILSGSQHALIRREFLDMDNIMLRNNVDTILVQLGETHSNTFTRELLPHLSKQPYDFKVVLDTHIANREQIIKKYKTPNIRFYNEEDIYVIAEECDMAICGINQFMYELATIGMPMIGVMLSKDKVKESQYLVRDRLIEILGAAGLVKPDQIISSMNRMAISYDKREDLQEALMKEFDGQSTVRAAKAVIKLLK